MPAGTVGYAPGYAMANVDSVDLTVHGRGGHGAYPQDTKDPIVVAARIVTTLQTLVSRELDPQDSGVVTVGSIHGGFKHNVIPDEVKLQLTVRSYSDATREKLLSGIERIAKGEAMAAGIDGKLAPEMSIMDDHTPSVYNTPALVERVTKALAKAMGPERISQEEPSMGGEDFARYGREEPKIPSFLFWIGAVKQSTYDASLKPGATPLPSLHSSLFAPDPDPTIATGVNAMTTAAEALLK